MSVGDAVAAFDRSRNPLSYLCLHTNQPLSQTRKRHCSNSIPISIPQISPAHTANKPIRIDSNSNARNREARCVSLPLRLLLLPAGWRISDLIFTSKCHCSSLCTSFGTRNESPLLTHVTCARARATVGVHNRYRRFPRTSTVPFIHAHHYHRTRLFDDRVSLPQSRLIVSP